MLVNDFDQTLDHLHVDYQLAKALLSIVDAILVTNQLYALTYKSKMQKLKEIGAKVDWGLLKKVRV